MPEFYVEVRVLVTAPDSEAAEQVVREAIEALESHIYTDAINAEENILDDDELMNG